MVLLPETDTEGAAVVAEKLRRSVAAIRLNAGIDLLSSTASIGVVAFPDDGRTADALTNRADQVMYAAKRAGRNRVSVEGHEAIGPAPPRVEPTAIGHRAARPGVRAPVTAHAGTARAAMARTPKPTHGPRRAVGARDAPERQAVGASVEPQSIDVHRALSDPHAIGRSPTRRHGPGTVRLLDRSPDGAASGR